MRSSRAIGATSGGRALALLDAAADAGGRIFGLTHSRGIGTMSSFRTQLPFDALPEWRTLRALPLAAQRDVLSKPDRRARLVRAAHDGPYGRAIGAEARQPDFDRMLVVEGSVDARVHGQCDGCLEDVDLPVHVDLDERLDPSHGRDVDPFGESNVLTGERLDVADLAQQSVLSALPMGLRCGPGCRGLCAICGANRNAGECSCQPA